MSNVITPLPQIARKISINSINKPRTKTLINNNTALLIPLDESSGITQGCKIFNALAKRCRHALADALSIKRMGRQRTLS